MDVKESCQCSFVPVFPLLFRNTCSLSKRMSCKRVISAIKAIEVSLQSEQTQQSEMATVSVHVCVWRGGGKLRKSLFHSIFMALFTYNDIGEVISLVNLVIGG